MAYKHCFTFLSTEANAAMNNTCVFDELTEALESFYLGGSVVYPSFVTQSIPSVPAPSQDPVPKLQLKEGHSSQGRLYSDLQTILQQEERLENLHARLTIQHELLIRQQQIDEELVRIIREKDHRQEELQQQIVQLQQQELQRERLQQQSFQPPAQPLVPRNFATPMPKRNRVRLRWTEELNRRFEVVLEELGPNG